MAHQHVLINGNHSQPGNLHTIQQYLVNNPIHTPASLQQHNVQVQYVQKDPQRYVIQNRQFVQQQNSQTSNGPKQIIQVSAAPPQQQQQQIQYQENGTYWLIVEVESNNELNSYAFVESKDVLGSPSLEALNTGTMVQINNGQVGKPPIRASVVMASGEFWVKS